VILHNSIRVAQNLSRRNSHAQIKLGDMPSLNNRIRLTYGDRDKGEQYSGSWQNNVKRGLEAPTKNVESCEDNQPSLRGASAQLINSCAKQTLLRGQSTALRGVTLFSFQIPIWLSCVGGV
jgi:hypothetical protein